MFANYELSLVFPGSPCPCLSHHHIGERVCTLVLCQATGGSDVNQIIPHMNEIIICQNDIESFLP